MQHLKTAAVAVITIIIVAGLAEILGVWGYVFQPYTKLKGGATVE